MQLGNHSAPTQELSTITRIWFIPAQVKTFPDERPDACKYCGSQILTRRGTADKSVTDLYEDKVTVVRCRCSDCESAFRHCSEEGDRVGQPGGCSDGLRSRGRLDCRRAPRATFSPPSASLYRA